MKLSSPNSINRIQKAITKMSIPVQHNKQWDWPLQQNDEFVKIVDDSTHFEVDLDAKYFAPKEIEVKTIGELIEIHMDHQARGNDITNVSRSITRCHGESHFAAKTRVTHNPMGGNLRSFSGKLMMRNFLSSTEEQPLQLLLFFYYLSSNQSLIIWNLLIMFDIPSYTV
ncbi:hypothetical protein Y032_0337g2897 [Ancylostoma ceylanicum]|uniref:SHSP domain-containing protein n=1 Tax=Ancylostoma ceylanicum TaxID=53326 RepID=A0A016RY79_9BILA|nr:hypothetical protein Y032_0337g2897 [Ancylostoma ceylanicum]